MVRVLGGVLLTLFLSGSSWAGTVQPTTLVHELQAQLTSMEEVYQVQGVRTEKLKLSSTGLEKRLSDARHTLDVLETPMKQTRDRYRQAQAHSLEYPDVSTEKERQAYLEAKRSVDDLAKGQREEVANLQHALEQEQEALKAAFGELEKVRHDLEVLGNRLREAKLMIRLAPR
ncbi:MAG: hypothetical protein HQL56_11130 [Magnetococcales bacterium]|nr:hypothetical protein [Magnetococcales bacterium]